MPRSYGLKVNAEDLAKLNGMQIQQGMQEGIRTEKVSDDGAAADAAKMSAVSKSQQGKFPQKGANNNKIVNNS